MKDLSDILQFTDKWIGTNYFTKEDHGFLDDNLHNRLVKLQSKHSKTKKRQSHKLRKTKRKN